MFAETIKKLLRQQDKKQGDLADYVGVKPNTVSDWLNKGTSPKLEHLYRIAEFFQVSYDYLFSGSDTLRDRYVDELKKDQKQLLKFYNELPEEEQLIILGEVAKRFKEQQETGAPDVYAAARDGGGFEKIEDQEQARKSSGLIRSRKKSDKPLP